MDSVRFKVLATPKPLTALPPRCAGLPKRRKLLGSPQLDDAVPQDGGVLKLQHFAGYPIWRAKWEPFFLSNRPEVDSVRFKGFGSAKTLDGLAAPLCGAPK